MKAWPCGRRRGHNWRRRMRLGRYRGNKAARGGEEWGEGFDYLPTVERGWRRFI